MEEKRITVIVAVYNIEDYLVRCLDSLLAQTYHNLQILLEIQPGDWLVIPKLHLKEEDGWHSFTLVECTRSYSFAPLGDDFGHIIGVKPIASYHYTDNLAALEISKNFRAYRNPINRVHSTKFQTWIQELMV